MDGRADAIEEHQRLRDSVPYREQETYLNRFSTGFVKGIALGRLAASRNAKLAKSSLSLNRADDLVESSLAAVASVREGMHNPARRETRFLIEASVKYLYVDQSMPGSNLEDRLEFFETTVNRQSIEIGMELKCDLLEPTLRGELLGQIQREYEELCGYVHPSVHHLRERAFSADRGEFVGFESVDQFRKINRDMVRRFDVVLALYFHAMGVEELGDLFVHGLDGDPQWKFHRSKYVSAVSSNFDYKAERKTTPRPGT